MRAFDFHWSPTSRRADIHAEGLRIGCRPVVNGVEDDHRNPWISLSPTPWQAWDLSAGALAVGRFTSESPLWDLWRADLTASNYTVAAEPIPKCACCSPFRQRS
jgi:hypothetical protein